MRQNLVQNLLERIRAQPAEGLTEDFAKRLVSDLEKHYKSLADKGTKVGAKRKLPYTNSVQCTLSRLKSAIKSDLPDVPVSFTNHLHVTRDQLRELVQVRAENTRNHSIDTPGFDLESIVLKARQILRTPGVSCEYKLIALAMLTGRRTSELLFSMQLSMPKERHSTPEHYWVSATGFLKHRNKKGEAALIREIPLLDNRAIIVKNLVDVRECMPASTALEVNKKYAHRIAAHIRTLDWGIFNIHQLRKLYGVLTHKYFNENKCSVARSTSDYLGHKHLSETVLTYMNIHDNGKGGKLDFTK